MLAPRCRGHRFTTLFPFLFFFFSLSFSTVRSCWEWENKMRSVIALVIFIFGCYYFEPYMIPGMALLILLKYYLVRHSCIIDSLVSKFSCCASDVRRLGILISSGHETNCGTRAVRPALVRAIFTHFYTHATKIRNFHFFHTPRINTEYRSPSIAVPKPFLVSINRLIFVSFSPSNA